MDALYFEMNEHQNHICEKLLDWFADNDCNLPTRIRVLIDDTSTTPYYIFETKTIFLATEHDGRYYGQFAYQLAHELVHAYIDEESYSHPLTWIIEIIACNISFYALNFLNDKEIEPDNYFFKHIELNRDSPCPIVKFKQIISGNLNLFIEDPNAVKKTPLIYTIYDNRDIYDIWCLLKSYKNWRDSYSAPHLKSTFNAFVLAAKSIESYLKINSDDWKSYSSLFNLDVSIISLASD